MRVIHFSLLSRLRISLTGGRYVCADGCLWPKLDRERQPLMVWRRNILRNPLSGEKWNLHIQVLPNRVGIFCIFENVSVDGLDKHILVRMGKNMQWPFERCRDLGATNELICSRHAAISGG